MTPSLADAADVEDSGGHGIGALLGRLDAVAAAARNAFRRHPGISPSGARGLVYAEEAAPAKRLPVPSRPKVTDEEWSRGVPRKFYSQQRRTGDVLRATGRLKPKILHPVTAERVVQPERNYTCPDGFKHFRASPTPQPFPTYEDRDDLCSEMHREWLKGHRNQRDVHLYPAYHALTQVDSLQEEQRLARDTAPPPQTAAEVAAAARLSRRIEQAKSLPALRLGPPPVPEGELRPLRSWAPPDCRAQTRTLREATPWRDQDDDMELFKRRQAARQTAPRRVLGATTSEVVLPSVGRTAGASPTGGAAASRETPKAEVTLLPQFETPIVAETHQLGFAF
eukprot:TRINITY_DN3798_c0_g1_i1.p1 TRINITY_DN3798_c0_g1~~TRINITY_DN3798_c0_g1_i1.p1  ORF type:complete len:338 (-),score=57.32 TRINITY_DN3798_c0_g1_i1:837-1850(-)